MLDGPYTSPNSEVSAILAKRSGLDDMDAIFAAAKLPYEIIHAELTAYHNERPAKGLFQSFDEHLREYLEQKAKTQGPREGIWDCHTWRIGRWRFQMTYLTAADDFYFDVFDEGGGEGSFTSLCNEAALKRRSKGWSAGPFKGSEGTVQLVGITDADMETLRAIAEHCGIGFVVDGMSERSPSEQGGADGHQKFIRWLSGKHPDALAGGKYDHYQA
jgi:hypothetical protein